MVALSDSEVVECFSAVENQFKDIPEVRAWMLFRECEVLFGRLLVQRAKSRLLEAEALAETQGERDLLLSIRHKKLFVRFEEMYSNQAMWIRDIVDEGLRLASDDTLASTRDSFGKNISIITNRILRGPMNEVGLKIFGFRERWHQNPFVFSMLAVWTISRKYRLNARVLAQIETYLRMFGAPVTESDLM